MKILVADDEKRFAKLLWEFLKLKGFTVETAFDGQEALDLIKKRSYDLVLLDFKMPELTGLEIIKYAKKLGIMMKVIVLSGQPDIDASYANFLGADEFIRKPVRFEVIEKAIRKLSGPPQTIRNRLKFNQP